MVSKLAFALLAPLLISIVWPAPPPLTNTNSGVATAEAGAGTQAAANSTKSLGGIRGDSHFKILDASQAVETFTPGAARMPLLTRNGARRPGAKSAATTSAARAPRTATPKWAPKVALYNNLNSIGLDATVNGANQDSPPDSTGAIGPNHYVEMVNSGIAVYNRFTMAYINSATLQNWLGADPATPYCDPQIQWDPSAARWLYTFLFCDTSTSSQDVHFGWSRTSDPSNLASGWCHYIVGTSPYLFDFPKLGHSKTYMLIGGNAYDQTVPGNTTVSSSQVFWIKKPAVSLSTCPSASTLAVGASPFPLLNPDSTEAFTPVPVNQTTTALNGYVVSAHDDNGGPQTKLAVWHVDSAGGWHADSDPTVASFSLPAPAPQLGSTNTIDTGDGRLTQAVGDPATGIWTQHTVAGPGGRSMVAWYEIKVVGTTASTANSGNITSTTDFVFNGAISPRTDTGGAAVIYNRSSATIDPVIAAQIRFTSTSSANMEPGELVLGTSAATDNDFSCNNPTLGIPCRWGDYSGASPDPVLKNLVWGSNQVTAVTGGPLIAGWASRNFALAFVTKPLAPTAVSAVAGSNGTVKVSWTPSTYLPTPPTASYTITAYVGVTPTFTLVVGAPATSAQFGGLTNGVIYTFTVFASNSVGDSAESVHSNAVSPGRPGAQSTPTPAPSRSPVPQSTPSPPPAR
jgi:hypothetical protein